MNTLKSYEMETMVAYEVVKSSSDHTLEVGDIIWLSKNRSLNGGGGCLDETEWNTKETNDFEVIKAEQYYINQENNTEGLRFIKHAPFYDYKEKWEELDVRLQKAKKELNQKLKTDISVSEKERIKQKLSGLSIAIEYMREAT